MPDRRQFLRALVGAIAAPAIVRIDNIMPVRAPPLVGYSGLSLVNIRDLLLPGLWEITSAYRTLPDQWQDVFTHTLDMRIS